MTAWRRWPVLAPVAAIGLAYLALGLGMSEDRFIAVFLVAHLAAPIWAASASRGTWGAFWRGPAILVAVHLLAVTVMLFLVAADPDSWAWIWLLFYWAAAVVAYAIYCAVIFAALFKRLR